MRTIWKYPIGESFTLSMPTGARVVHAERQGQTLCLWAEVETTAAPAERTFEVVGTGHPIPAGAVHVHTWQDPPYVWHLYEVLAEQRSDRRPPVLTEVLR